MENKRLSKNFTTTYKNMAIELNEKIKTINCGGCGCYALSLSKKLNELGYEHKFVVVYHQRYSLNKGKKYLRENNMGEFLHCGWTHIMLKINNKLVDSEGIFNKLSDRYPQAKKYHSVVEEQYVKQLVGVKYVWNPIFNRRNVKKIENILEKSLCISN